ncbi:MAG: Lanosterol 14-alpha-demethylase [Cirrosporium novae-zelandiae]|nr:MAG: Lanosterol 14-alpha-demethylase [Cirrosporium novae-zelandiae]
MGLLSTLAGPIAQACENKPTALIVCGGLTALFVLLTVLNILKQLLFKNKREPPIVFHWVPFIGSTVTYGMAPYDFFDNCRKKYGDVFTFILLGKKTTVYLGTAGNNFILNGKLKDVNAEDIYGPLTTPVFGHDVVYDCPNSKLMEQKKFIKFGLSADALRSYVPLIAGELQSYIDDAKPFQGRKGTIDVAHSMAEITIYTASRSLQGKEVRERFDSTFADLYADLDNGFQPINFMLPWAPLPVNKRRDRAQQKMTQVYMDIIKERRKPGATKGDTDMIWNLMGSIYKNGVEIPDEEIAHMMIALLMAGQHSSAATGAYMILRIASRPDIIEDLYQEQLSALGNPLPPLTFDHLQKLPLHNQTIKETLRLHAPIHSIMRAVKSDMPVPGTAYVVPKGHTLLAAPGVSARDAMHFKDPMRWEPHRWDNGAQDHHLRADDEEKVDYGFGEISKGGHSPYLPFGAGRHRCIGEQFAYVQLGAILATFVRNMTLRNLDGSDKVVDTDFSSLFAKPLTPAIVEWEKREKK